jgi:hypothetical protein
MNKKLKIALWTTVVVLVFVVLYIARKQQEEAAAQAVVGRRSEDVVVRGGVYPLGHHVLPCEPPGVLRAAAQPLGHQLGIHGRMAKLSHTVR